MICPGDLCVTIDAIQEVAKLLPALAMVPFGRRRQFSTDLALVVTGVRTAYLVDLFFLSKPVEVYSQLVEYLRLKSQSAPHSPFQKIVHVYDVSGQSFFVNVDLFTKRRRSLQSSFSGTKRTKFISLEEPPKLLPTPPTDVVSLIDSVAAATHTLAPSALLPQGLTQQTLIPFAAFLLEYPVAYVPTSGLQKTFLSGIPLDVYECIITHVAVEADHHPSRYSLMKFSCPKSLSLAESSLSPEKIICALVDRFGSERLGNVQGLVFDVKHHVDIHDRVAL